MSEILLGHNTTFYSQHYTFSFSFFPNWLTHAVLSILQLFLNPFLSEKIFVSAYLICMPLFFGRMINAFAAQTNYLIWLCFAFSFHFVFYYGFYNFSYSVAFAFLFVWLWQQSKGFKLYVRILYLLPVSLLIYTTHIFGWFLLGVLMFCLLIIELTIGLRSNSPVMLKEIIRTWLPVAISGVPPVVLSLLFMHGHSAEMQYYPETPQRLFDAFYKLEMLVIWGSNTEYWLIQLIAVIIVLLLIVSLYARIKKQTSLLPHDGFLLAAVVFVLIYFMQPKMLFLAGFWVGRMSWLFWIMALAWICCNELPQIINYTAGILAFLLFTAITLVRLPYQQATSQALEDYLSAVEKIPAYSTVLPLSFSHLGINETGQPISNYRIQFLHAFDYCGAIKPIINYANYEATTSWFPVQWKKDCNMFDLVGNIEGNPCSISLQNIETNKCSDKIDYVVTWAMGNNCGLWSGLNNQFKQVYISPSGHCRLWKNIYTE